MTIPKGIRGTHTALLWSLPLAMNAQHDVRETGSPYFQQRVDHVIHVRLDDMAHMLHGHGTFAYTNNSGTTLDTIWVHLWPNAYSQRHTALERQLTGMGEFDLHFAAEEDRGRIDSLAFSSEGEALKWGLHPQHVDVGWVKLTTSLAPGGMVTIDTPFRVKIPDSKFSRLGHTGQAYHITQWFPKPAVFDRHGWHAMPYLTQGEFYSEFGRYDVSITLPANYVVGATGLLQDAASEEAWMDDLAERPIPTEPGKEANAFPPSDPRMKTLRFVQDSVHDFAWFADKRFIVRKGTATLERSGRVVTTWALFTPRNARTWSAMAIESLNESVKLYSRWVGDYPYAACTAVDGTISAGGGMEYPMITIIGNMTSTESLDNVIAHEVGHNWFFGILASNERLHPWMDEGMNSFVELRYMRERHPQGGLAIIGNMPFLRGSTGAITDGHRYMSEAGYRINARRGLDQPPSEGAAHFTPMNYGGMVYNKTALVFDHLFAYLGEDVFDRCMHSYFEEWKFRHPGPADVRRVFERESGKDLAWVFDDLLGSPRKLEARAIGVRSPINGQVSSPTTVDITVRGVQQAPIPVTGYLHGDSLGTVWVEGDRRRQAELPWLQVDRIRIDAGSRTLDIDRRNNDARTTGILRTWAKPHFRWLLGLERQDHRSTYLTPIVAWNDHDGVQLGLAAYNTVFPSQRSEWVVVPLYGLASQRPVGAARFDRHLDRIQSRLFQNIHLGVDMRSASTFQDALGSGWYAKVAPRVGLDIARDPLSRFWHHSVGLRAVLIHLEQVYGSMDGSASVTDREDRPYAVMTYEARKPNGLLPASLMADVTMGESWVRASVDARQAFTYDRRGNQVRLRLFAGSFLYQPDQGLPHRTDRWDLSWYAEDMLFDHAYLNRLSRRGGANDFASRQFQKQQGAFKTPFSQGGSDAWVTALNLELDLPGPLPLALFASGGWVPFETRTFVNGVLSTSSGTAAFYEAGFGVQLMRDVIELWVPLLVSDRIRDEERFAQRQLGDRIRFVLALDRLDPTKALRRLKP